MCLTINPLVHPKDATGAPVPHIVESETGKLVYKLGHIDTGGNVFMSMFQGFTYVAYEIYPTVRLKPVSNFDKIHIYNKMHKCGKDYEWNEMCARTVTVDAGYHSYGATSRTVHITDTKDKRDREWGVFLLPHDAEYFVGMDGDIVSSDIIYLMPVKSWKRLSGEKKEEIRKMAIQGRYRANGCGFGSNDGESEKIEEQIRLLEGERATVIKQFDDRLSELNSRLQEANAGRFGFRELVHESIRQKVDELFSDEENRGCNMLILQGICKDELTHGYRIYDSEEGTALLKRSEAVPYGVVPLQSCRCKEIGSSLFDAVMLNYCVSPDVKHIESFFSEEELDDYEHGIYAITPDYKLLAFKYRPHDGVIFLYRIIYDFNKKEE